MKLSVLAVTVVISTMVNAHATTTLMGRVSQTLSFDLPKLSKSLPMSELGWSHTIGEQCLGLALYHEARGEPRQGQEAVAQVILNRVKSRKYPNTICGVVYQNAHKLNRCQFSFACDALSDAPRETKSIRALLQLGKTVMHREKMRSQYTPNLRNPDTLKVAQMTHYHALAVSPAWGKKLEPIKIIGDHIFYRSERVAKSL